MIKGISEYEKYKVIRPMIGGCDYDSFSIPIIKKTNVNCIDWDKLSICGVQNLSKKRDNSNSLIHMFLDDKKLLALWNNPLKKIALFRTCAAIATPDFSIYPSMNYNDIRHNIYMNRWLGCTWQNYGNTVIPTIGWAGTETFDLCFSAVEEGTPVIISTIGCQNHEKEFLVGFNEMKKRLKPPMIIVFGDMITGMTGKFINFRYTDRHRTAEPTVERFSEYVQMKLDGFSAVFEIKEAV